ncbi:hypothetical protein KFU94_33995 [Chloroflexi bacterium TSY]|nr:hypothetical protein [Chloroflexi bacterium TSY]
MNVVDSSGWLEYFADSIIWATAQANHAVLWTQDSDFRDIEGINYVEKQ